MNGVGVVVCGPSVLVLPHVFRVGFLTIWDLLVFLNGLEDSVQGVGEASAELVDLPRIAGVGTAKKACDVEEVVLDGVGFDGLALEGGSGCEVYCVQC